MLDWTAKLLGLPDGWHGHIEDTASTGTMAAMIAARETTGRNEVVCSEHTHSAVEKGARMLGMDLRKVATDDEFRLRVDELGDLGRAAAGGGHGGHDGQRLGRSGAGDRRRVRGRGDVAARRRRLRRQRHGVPRVPLGL